MMFTVSPGCPARASVVRAGGSGSSSSNPGERKKSSRAVKQVTTVCFAQKSDFANNSKCCRDLIDEGGNPGYSARGVLRAVARVLEVSSKPACQQCIGADGDSIICADGQIRNQFEMLSKIDE
jgi:hypothetical protein